ncbi:MAG: 3-deoxy-manno-octulosonate cytidylyltransferase [Desulfohalobium sp.]
MTNTAPRCVGIIPARYASSRFPGKPLAPILGRPMFWHVYARACQSPSLTQVMVATDDERIAAKAHEEQVPVQMTRAGHPSGSDRILEVAERLGLDAEDILVNIQGDEPALEPAMLSELVRVFTRPEVRVSTLVRNLPAKEVSNPNTVKVVTDREGRALYFSRAPIPYTTHKTPVFLGHVGLYAYRLSSLRAFSALGPSELEQIEHLEQLRFLEAGIPIHTVHTTYRCHGVDCPEDIAHVEHILKESL